MDTKTNIHVGSTGGPTDRIILDRDEAAPRGVFGRLSDVLGLP